MMIRAKGAKYLFGPTETLIVWPLRYVDVEGVNTAAGRPLESVEGELEQPAAIRPREMATAAERTTDIGSRGFRAVV
jgi:hypothetical protein